MQMLRKYIEDLSTGRIVLWCYFIWYLVVAVLYFEPSLKLWLTSLGLSLFVGTALCVNAASGAGGKASLGRWQAFRFYLIPFCVSSFSSLVKDRGFILIFSPRLSDELTTLAIYAALGLMILAVKKSKKANAAD